MHWYLSHRFDPRAVQLADRHYSRQKRGTPQFVPPGRCLVLLTKWADALWVTSWPFAKYTHHAWAGAWVCSLFRNESSLLSSTLIQEAVAVTRWYFGEPPSLGFITFVNPDKIQSTNPGYCYKQAGWKRVGTTKRGLITLQLVPEAIPCPVQPHYPRYTLFEDLLVSS